MIGNIQVSLYFQSVNAANDKRMDEVDANRFLKQFQSEHKGEVNIVSSTGDYSPIEPEKSISLSTSHL